VSRRSLVLLPAALAALALPVAPAFAGEDPSAPTPAPPAAAAPPSNSAALHASQGCVTGRRVKATVTGTNLASVTFSVDGKRMKRVTRPASNGSYSFSMSCARLSVGAHRARASVAFQGGGSQTLRFQITRTAQTAARFTG
jgi:hypothetical protein